MNSASHRFALRTAEERFCSMAHCEQPEVRYLCLQRFGVIGLLCFLQSRFDGSGIFKMNCARKSFGAVQNP
jgi:hypothetical protein